MADNRQRGLIGLATDITQQGRAGMSGGAALPDSGASQAFASVAGEIEQVGKKIGQWADHAAQVEGAQAGELAGLDPEFRPGRTLTIRGEAFDKAGLGVMQARMKQEIAGEFEGMADKHGMDPVKIQAAIADKRGKWLDAAPEEIKAELTLFIAGQSNTAVRTAARTQRAMFAAEQAAQAHAEFATEMKAAQQKAYQLGLDPEADAALAQSHGAINRLLHRKGADGRPLFSPAERVKTLERLKEEMAEARTIGAFHRLGSLDEKARFIDQVEEHYRTGGGVSKAFSRDQFHRLQNELRADFSRDRVEAQRGETQVRHDLGNLERLAAKGFELPARDMASLETRVGAARNPELAQQWADAHALAGFVKEARRAPPQKLDAELARIRETMQGPNGATPRALKLLDVGEQLLKSMHQELKNDPIGWADRVGLQKAVPLDVSDPVRFSVSIRERAAQAEALGEHYGQKVDYLRPDETHALSAEIAKGGQRALAILGGISEGAPKQAPDIMRELGKHGPATAQLGMLYQSAGATPAVRDALNGLALARTADFKPLAPEVSKGRNDVVEATRGALGNRPEVEQAVVALASSIYEVRARSQGVRDFNSGLWSQAVKEALGETKVGGKTYGGVVTQGGWMGATAPIVLPPYLRQDAWRDLVRAITPADLDAAGLGRPVGADGREISWSRMLGGTLMQTDRSRFAVALGNAAVAGEEQPAVSSLDRNKPFILDLDRLRPHLARRRPDLFLVER